MRKVSIIKRKIIRAYNNKENREYSKFKGYPEDTYFGYETLDELLKSYICKYKKFYGGTIRNMRYV